MIRQDGSSRSKDCYVGVCEWEGQCGPNTCLARPVGNGQPVTDDPRNGIAIEPEWPYNVIARWWRERQRRSEPRSADHDDGCGLGNGRNGTPEAGS